MSRSFTTTCPAELPSLEELRDFVDQVCRQMRTTEEDRYDIKLAVDEAAANIIQYGYKDMPPGVIILEISCLRKKAVIRLTDFGRPFDPSKVAKPNLNAPLEERASGGLGIYFIYKLMSDVQYQSGEAGNTLTMTKQFE